MYSNGWGYFGRYYRLASQIEKTFPDVEIVNFYFLIKKNSNFYLKSKLYKVHQELVHLKLQHPMEN